MKVNECQACQIQTEDNKCPCCNMSKYLIKKERKENDSTELYTIL